MSLNDALDKNGYFVCEQLSSPELAYNISQELTSTFNGPDIIKVNDDGINIKTVNGNQLLTSSPSTEKLYRQVLAFLTKELGMIYELEDNKIGISANLLESCHDNFRLHFDRNQLTVVIYITESENFPLVLYPKMREDPRTYPGNSHPPVKPKEQTTPVKVYPEPGLGVLFWGRRTLHGISFENPNKQPTIGARYSLQFAFDLTKTDYSGEQYYGK